MLFPDMIGTNFGCIACDATGGASAMGMQTLLCVAVGGFVMFRVAAEDALNKLLRRDRLAEDDSADDRETEGLIEVKTHLGAEASRRS